MTTNTKTVFAEIFLLGLHMHVWRFAIINKENQQEKDKKNETGN